VASNHVHNLASLINKYSRWLLQHAISFSPTKHHSGDQTQLAAHMDEK